MSVALKRLSAGHYAALDGAYEVQRLDAPLWVGWWVVRKVGGGHSDPIPTMREARVVLDEWRAKSVNIL